MSYEILRADFASKLTEFMKPELMQLVLSALDQSADRFEIKPKNTDLIVRQDFLEPVRLYIASKSVENLAVGTLKNYYRTLSKFINAMQRPINEITAVNIRVYLDNYKRTRGIKDSTQEVLRVTIKDFFTWCMDEGLIQSNPCSHVKAIKIDDNTRQPMSRMELEMIRKACGNPRESALVEVLYSTAARVSEVCNMKISDIDFVEKTIVITRGKGGKRRTAYLNAKAILAIRSYLETRDDSSEYLFVNIRGGNKHKLCKGALETVVKHITARTDVQTHVTPHVFRTTTSTHAIDSGMPIEQVQRMLGHAKIQTTLRYAKISDVSVKNSHQKFIA